MKILKIHKDALLPVFLKEGDACADIHCYEDLMLEPRDITAVPTGIKMEIPSGFECQIRPRSGLSLKKQLLIMNTPGTIDAGYRGEIFVILKNLSDEVVILVKGMLIAQLAIRPIPNIHFLEVGTLNESQRGTDGLGSTGVGK